MRLRAKIVQSSSSLSTISLPGCFGSDPLTILTSPVIIWNVQPDMDEMLAPENTASRAFELDEIAEQLTEVTLF